jgi:hypothetical protein
MPPGYEPLKSDDLTSGTIDSLEDRTAKRSVPGEQVAVAVGDRSGPLQPAVGVPVDQARHKQRVALEVQSVDQLGEPGVLGQGGLRDLVEGVPLRHPRPRASVRHCSLVPRLTPAASSTLESA